MPDHSAHEVLSIHSAGADHVQLTNMTPLADRARVASIRRRAGAKAAA